MNESRLFSRQQALIADANIDFLLEQRQVVRILQPTLRQQIEQAIQVNPSLSSYVWPHQGELYLLLTSINDASRRGQVYDLIQRYQIDPTTDLDKAPYGLRACLQPHRHRQGRRMGAFALGAVVGMMLGLIGMALSVVMTVVLGLEGAAWERITAVTFVVCSALGWAGATYYLWYKYPFGFWRN
ncbi:MAG: hypothetical protein HND44_04750 [Chloroflexi bacterium]|nr:hypothetical protein [Ardenticatenaceae bacterium]NOG33872.1 hypothetical protein [Chloroflexota bacterium]GIK54797.1 MAG: hypothetical protein BroJett015_04600 [Chloroflexota bacterium]